MMLLEKGRWRWDYYEACDEELILILGSKLFTCPRISLNEVASPYHRPILYRGIFIIAVII